MTDEERQRAMDFIVAQQAKSSVEIDRLLESQRKAELRFERDEFRLDRDERILKLVIRMLDDDKRWREFDRQSRRRFAEISEFAARSDEKLKALIDDTRNDRNKPRP